MLFKKDTDKYITGTSEEEIYKKLSLAYIEPELRENRGEIEAASKNKLPKLVKYDDIKGDLHVHSNWSDGFETIEVPHQNYKPSVGNVICLQENEVIANAAENMETINILENNGVTVHHLDLSEFRKGAGGPTCLILPIERK